MSHPFDILTLDNGSRLIFTPCPGTKGASVAESIQVLKEAGAQAMITMMTAAELKAHQTQSITDWCDALNISWFHLPVEDSCAPASQFEQAYATHQHALMALINNQTTLVIHCHGGSGRTGMMAAILMLAIGYEPGKVKTEIQTIRPKSLKSPVQVSYLIEHHGYLD